MFVFQLHLISSGVTNGPALHCRLFPLPNLNFKALTKKNITYKRRVKETFSYMKNLLLCFYFFFFLFSGKKKTLFRPHLQTAKITLKKTMEKRRVFCSSGSSSCYAISFRTTKGAQKPIGREVRQLLLTGNLQHCEHFPSCHCF